MHRTTQISLIYLLYAFMAKLGVLPLETLTGTAVLLGASLELPKASHNHNWQESWYKPITNGENHILYAWLWFCLLALFVSSLLYLGQSARANVVLIAGLSAHILQTGLSQAYSWAEVNGQHSRFFIRFDLPVKLAIVFVTINLIADPIIPRAFATSMAILQQLGVPRV